MRTVISMALLVLLILAAFYGLASAISHSYISNQSSRNIGATIRYIDSPAESKFYERIITAGTYQGDQYSTTIGGVEIEMWVDSPGVADVVHNAINVIPDRSVVAVDNNGKTAVDVYLAKYGTLIQEEGGILTTVFPP